ncbi:MAG: hypothetical protein ACOYLO_00060 [Ferruginibacter sp.]
MGYTNEVGLAITATGYSKLLEYNASEVIVDCLESADEHSSNAQTNSRLFIWHCTKWDRSYSDVEALLVGLAEVDICEYVYVRLGEDSSDEEIMGNWRNNDFQFGFGNFLYY